MEESRDDPKDRSHRPHKLSTTLSEGQEIVVAEIRRLMLRPLDDLLVVVREFINPAVSRSALDRCLRRHGVGNLRELQAAAREADGEATAKNLSVNKGQSHPMRDSRAWSSDGKSQGMGSDG